MKSVKHITDLAKINTYHLSIQYAPNKLLFPGLIIYPDKAGWRTTILPLTLLIFGWCYQHQCRWYRQLTYCAILRAKGLCIMPLSPPSTTLPHPHPGTFYTIVPVFGLRDPVLDCKQLLIPSGISVSLYFESARGREKRREEQKGPVVYGHIFLQLNLWIPPENCLGCRLI